MDRSSRIAKNTLALYVRSFAILLISLYTSRVFLKVLGVVDYGIYNVVGGIIAMLGFLNSSMQSAFQRYYNYELGKGNETKVKELFGASLGVQVLLIIIIIVLSETVGLWLLDSKLTIPTERVYAAKWVYQVSILSFCLTTFSAPFGAIITAYEKMHVYAIISIVDAVLRLIIVFVLNFVQYDKLIVYSVLLLFIGILNLLVYWIYCKIHIKVASLKFNWNLSDIKTLTSFSGWTITGTLAYTLKSQGINILLNIFFSPVINAARGISYQILGAVNQFITSFQTAFRPQLTQSYASGNYDYMRKLYYSGSKISYYLIYTISLPIILETGTILHLWLGDNVPEFTISFTRIILLTAFVSAFANPTTGVVYATGRIKTFSICISTLNLMIVPVAYVFLKMGYGPLSAMVVSFVITVLVQIARLYYASKVANLNIKEYLRKVILPVSIYSVLTLSLPLMSYRLMEDGLLRLLLVCFLSFTSSCLFVLLIGLEKYEKELIYKKLKISK